MQRVITTNSLLLRASSVLSAHYNRLILHSVRHAYILKARVSVFQTPQIISANKLAENTKTTTLHFPIIMFSEKDEAAEKDFHSTHPPATRKVHDHCCWSRRELDIPLKAVWAVTNSQKIGWDGGGQKLQKIFVMASGCKDDLDHHCQTFSNAILFWSHKKTCFAVRMRGAL